MATQPLNGVLQHLRKVAAVRTDRELSDRELLDCFIERRDESAFTVLIERHGPMVLGVCRRSLPNFHDAEDACQATFLVLARKAALVRKKSSLGSWLHGVACRVAANLKRDYARRKAREREVGAKVPMDPAAEVTWREVQTILDEELQRLPERYRTPMILCYLECMTRDEAAQQLGLSPTTLHGRLEAARGLLRDHLKRRGLTLPGVMSAAVLGGSVAQAALTPTLVVSSTKAAVLLATGQSVTEGVVTNQVLALTQEVIKSMFITKLKLGAAALLGAGLFVALVGGSLSSPATQDGKQGPPAETLTPEKTPQKQEKERDKEAVTAWDKGDAEAPKKAAPKTDEEKLQGVWKLVRMEMGGQVVGEEETSLFPELVFDGNRIENDKGKQPAPFPRGAFTLDTTKNSKKITIITDFDGASFPSKGVYELDGDDLKICIDFNHVGKRNYQETTELKTIAGKSQVLYSFKRDKAKKEDLPKGLKADLTAWGKEVGGLQAGLGFRPGEKRAYHHGETLTLVVRVRNVRNQEVKFQYLRQFFIENPPTVTDAEGKPVPIEGVAAAGGQAHEPVAVVLAPGKEIDVYQLQRELRPASEANKLTEPDSVERLWGAGKVGIQYERVFGNSSSGTIKLDPALGKLGTGRLELEIKSDPPPADEKKPKQEKVKDLTAWGKEAGGLQAGVSLRPGEKQVYRHGDVITLVVRVRNVGKEAVKFKYVRQFLDEELPTVTNADGKTVEQHRFSMLGFHAPTEVTLEPGKEIELESRLPLRYELRPPNGGGEPSTKESTLFVGPGKVSLQYDRVLGSSSSGAIKVDPKLSKLGTGKLELDIKADPPPQEQKKADSDDEEKAVRAYVEELRAAAKVSGQQIYNVAIRPMYYKSVRWAARKGEDKLVVELYRLYRGLPENADPGGTALTWAAAHNDAETVKILLDRGLDVNAADDQGRTALHQAIFWGPHNVGQLLEKGARVNVKTKNGETPLMLAAQASHPEVVTMLLDKKAEVNARDEEDRTALMHAAKAGRLANARALLGHGANVRLKDKAGRTALALVQAPNLLFNRPGLLTKDAAQKLEEQAVRDGKELRALLQSAGDKEK